MEIKLAPPYAECYSLEYPLKVHRKLYEYVEERLSELHPGFSKESLWDFRAIRGAGIKKIEAAVIEKDFYMEKRLSQRRTRFYIRNSGGEKIFLFEESCFDVKGERKKKKWLLLAVVFIAAFISGSAIFALTGRREENVPESEVYEVEQIEEALNVFDALNECAAVIKDAGGSIRLVSFSAASEGNIKFSVSGCEPYALVRDISELEGTQGCSCNSVNYSGGKESFELDVKVRLPAILQKNCSELELLEIQNQVTEVIRTSGANLLSSGADGASGRMSFLIECNGGFFSAFNEMLEKNFRERGLFAVFFEEAKVEGKDLFTVKTELIVLEEKQKVENSGTEEYLSQVFEKDDEIRMAGRAEDKGRTKIVVQETIPSGWKKIGSVKKEGRELYYYRTEAGKIESSEADYE